MIIAVNFQFKQLERRSLFFRLLLSNCLNWKFTAMIILHFPLIFHCSIGSSLEEQTARLSSNYTELHCTQNIVGAIFCFMLYTLYDSNVFLSFAGINLAVRVSDKIKLRAAMFVLIAICSAFITFAAGEINK